MPVYSTGMFRNQPRAPLHSVEGIGVLRSFVTLKTGVSTFRIPSDRKDEFKRVLEEGRRYFGDVSSFGRALSCNWETGHASFRNDQGRDKLEPVLRGVAAGLGAQDSVCSSYQLAIQLTINSREFFIKTFTGVAHVLGLLEAVCPDPSTLTYDAWVALGDNGDTPYGGTYEPDYYPMSAFSVSMADRGVTISITHVDEHRVTTSGGDSYGYNHARQRGQHGEATPSLLSANILFTPQQDVCPTKSQMDEVINDFLALLETRLEVDHFVPEESWRQSEVALRVPAPQDRTVLDRLGIQSGIMATGTEKIYAFVPSRNLYETPSSNDE